MACHAHKLDVVGFAKQFVFLVVVARAQESGSLRHGSVYILKLEVDGFRCAALPGASHLWIPLGSLGVRWFNRFNTKGHCRRVTLDRAVLEDPLDEDETDEVGRCVM